MQHVFNKKQNGFGFDRKRCVADRTESSLKLDLIGLGRQQGLQRCFDIRTTGRIFVPEWTDPSPTKISIFCEIRGFVVIIAKAEEFLADRSMELWTPLISGGAKNMALRQCYFKAIRQHHYNCTIV